MKILRYKMWYPSPVWPAASLPNQHQHPPTYTPARQRIELQQIQNWAFWFGFFTRRSVFLTYVITWPSWNGEKNLNTNRPMLLVLSIQASVVLVQILKLFLLNWSSRYIVWFNGRQTVRRAIPSHFYISGIEEI